MIDKSSSRKALALRSAAFSTREGVSGQAAIRGEHSLNKREVGGSIPSPATNKKFKWFDLRWAEPVGLPECPYMVRWVLVVFGFSVRVHHWLASDDQRHPHDHAWDYVAIILFGAYWEHQADRNHFRRAGAVTRYSAEHRHTVELFGRSCWSLLFTGRPRRAWGFYPAAREGKMLRPLRYFSRYGHHPCE